MKEERGEAGHGPTRSEPQVAVDNVLYFARLQPTVADNNSFLLLPRRAEPQHGKPNDGRTHEVFVVITQHDGVTRSGSNGGLWGSICRVARDMGVEYDVGFEENHAWIAFAERLVLAFGFSGPPCFFACGNALCIGVATAAKDRKRASVLSAAVWTANNSEAAFKLALQDDSEVQHFFVGYAMAKRAECGCDMCWNGVRTVVSLVRCCEEEPGASTSAPCMSPPAGPPLGLVLPSVDSFVGYVPRGAGVPDVKPQPPWNEAREPAAKLSPATQVVCEGGPTSRVRLIRGPESTTTPPWSKVRSGRHDSHNTGSGSRASSASSVAGRRPRSVRASQAPPPTAAAAEAAGRAYLARV